MKKVRIKMIGAAMFCLLFIIGCGGGGGGDPVVVKEAILSVSPATSAASPHDFGGFPLSYSSDKVFTITNSGNFPAVITLPTNSEHFSFVNIDCPEQPNKLAGDGASCKFIARFNPKSQGIKESSISFAGGAAPVYLKGEGYGLSVWINQADFTNCADVQVGVTVTNSAGAVGALGLSNFRLWQNDVEQILTAREINPNPDPVSMVLTLDLSSSLSANIDEIKTASQNFIDLLNETDEAAICKFKNDTLLHPEDGDTPLLIQTDGTGKNALKSNIKPGADPASPGTALYDALHAAIERATHGNYDKRAVVLLSDGADSPVPAGKETYNLDQVIQYAKTQGIAIFTIYYVGSSTSPGDIERLQKLAADTGGQYFNSESVSLATIFTQVRSVLGSRYTIHYNAGLNCTGTIPLRVRVQNGIPYGEGKRTFIVP